MITGPSGQAQQTWGAGATNAPVADPAARWADMLADAKAHRWRSVADTVVPLPIELLLDALEPTTSSTRSKNASGAG